MVDSLGICTALLPKFHYLICFDIGKAVILVCWQIDKPCFFCYYFLINIIVNIHLVFLNCVPQEGIHSLQLIEKSVWWFGQILEVMLLTVAIYDLIHIKSNLSHFSLMQYVCMAKSIWLFVIVFLTVYLFFCCI